MSVCGIRVLNLFKALIVVGLLGVPLLVITALPKFFEVAGSVPALGGPAGPAPTPGFRLADPTPGSTRPRFAPLQDTPPPTLAPPVAVNQVATPQPSPTGERIVIGNTDGVGAILRSEPVTGAPVAALREGLVLEVLERRGVAGNGDWVRVRTTTGTEGWVTGLAALPVAAAPR
jgi:hypothetical protein